MANIGSVILTDLGIAALSNANISNPINIATFTVSNTSTPLDPTLTNFTGWITQTVTGLTLIDDNTFEISCVVEPDEAIDQMASVGVFLDDGTLFSISNPSTPIPSGMRQILKSQITYTNCSSVINFNYLPWGLDDQNLLILDNQVTMLNNLMTLSSKNQIFDALKDDYYNHKASYTSYRDIYVDSVEGRNSYYDGSNNNMPVKDLDYAIDLNRTYRFTRYNLVDNDIGYSFLNRSHTLYKTNIIIQPYEYSDNLNTNYSYVNGTTGTPMSSWKVLDELQPLYSDAYNIVINLSKYISQFSYPEIIENTISISSGSVNPGYWVACMPLQDYYLTNNTMLNINISASDDFQIFTVDYLNNAQLVFESNNFNTSNTIFTQNTPSIDSGANYNINITLQSYTTYIAVIVWNSSIKPTYLSIIDNTNTTSFYFPTLTVSPSNPSTTCNYLLLDGNCNITFENLNINFSNISLQNMDSIIKGLPNSNSYITIINSNLTLSPNLCFITSEYYNNPNYFGKVGIRIINSTITTNGGYLVMTSKVNPDIVMINSSIDNQNNIVYYNSTG
ncbi:MAG: hypothetical protein QW478_06775 [Candidatus Micrarchaeaceae archaeon]